jgi:hypothetical protein
VSLWKRIAPVVAAAAALIAAIAGGLLWYRARPTPTADLMKRLPTRDALLLCVDFDALRRGGILQMLDAAKPAEDPDYQSFVRETHFDYRRDLDLAVVSFAPAGKFMLVRGRFDWKSLEEYAREKGGGCTHSFCRMQGSARERQISFFPVQSGLMALAVSPDQYAARRLEESPTGQSSATPTAPIWLSIPSSMLRSGEGLPSGTRMFVRGMDQAESVVLTFSAEGDRIAAHLDVQCRDEHAAAEIASQLASTTSRLRDMIEREHMKPNPADLSGVLTSGSFRTEGARVVGYWPIERSFVENLLGGGAG